MKKQIIIGLLMIMSAMSGLHAQDTIDTNYYRYDNHLRSALWGGVDSRIEGVVSACPNGMGFSELIYWRFDHRLYESCSDSIEPFAYHGVCRHNGYIVTVIEPHMYYQLGSRGQTVYGIAFAIDTIFNLTEGDSMTAILCTRSADHTQFVDLDSITIKGGEIGKRRWIELPMLRSDAYSDTFAENGPYEDCIDTVMYRQVLELYFDGRSHTIDDDFLFWKLRVSDGNGSVFFGFLAGHLLSDVAFAILEGEEVQNSGLGMATWDFLFPVLSPLPEWEEPSVCQIVPDAQKPDTPDNPQDPEDPDDPQDLDDPDNPGGDEGIGEADGVPGFDMRPNPTGGMTTITSAEPISELTVRDMAGRTVLRKAACGTTATFDTSTFRKGVYLVKVTTTRGTVTKKLVVK